MQSAFPEDVQHETAAAYFWAGVVTGVLHFEDARAWAFSVIEALDAPPIEVIEVATARDRVACIDALQAAAHGGDLLCAGPWLFADLLNQLEAGARPVPETIYAAMRVASTTGLPDDCYYAFDALDDELQMAINNVCFTVDQARHDLIKTLVQYANQ
ncbi:hypothetical protein SAMN05428989_1821 [Pseudoxanthomonas sp. GM95]|uniref:hypothetical protein n=1 Tax=Pseudoxanthomonas sp. GM95 TaxID=1881043 RepID=UPI0008ADF6FA|nr:hypothetical protein [Pseudoxanthomonas sp. GM95]SEL51492.1 hypothetical protein SAMN05428989_1821 [Pseudoxanthomonas sp. GM95]